MKIVTEFCLILSCIMIFRSGLVHTYKTDLEEFREMTAPTRKRCIAETGTTLQAIEDTEYGKFPDDERLMCYFKCVTEKFGMMDKKTGMIKFKLLKLAIPPLYKDIYSVMIDSCTEITGKDNCEKAYNFAKCTYNVNPVAFITP